MSGYHCGAPEAQFYWESFEKPFKSHVEIVLLEDMEDGQFTYWVLSPISYCFKSINSFILLGCICHHGAGFRGSQMEKWKLFELGSSACRKLSTTAVVNLEVSWQHLRRLLRRKIGKGIEKTRRSTKQKAPKVSKKISRNWHHEQEAGR